MENTYSIMNAGKTARMCVKFNDYSKKAVIVDIDMEGHGDELELGISQSGLNIKELAVRLPRSGNVKAYPGIRRLVIGEGIRDISISNAAFPNVKEVVSRSPYFASGNCLVRTSYGCGTLLNAFHKGPDETIDFAGADGIGVMAFEGCKAVKAINFSQIQQANDDAFKGYAAEYSGGNLTVGNVLVKAGEMNGEVRIPPNVTCATPWAFDGLDGAAICVSSLRSFMALNTKPKSGHLTLRPEFRNGEDWAKEFRKTDMARNGCFSTIDVPGYDLAYKSADGIVYSKDGYVLKECPAGREDDVHIEDGVRSIAGNAFWRTKAKHITFPDSLRTIDSHSFFECAFEEITLPKGVVYVGEDNFCGTKHIRQESQVPVNGLLAACLERANTGGWTFSEGAPMTVDVGGVKVACPSCMANTSEVNALFNAWDRGEFGPEMNGKLYTYASTSELKQDTALLALELAGGEQDTEPIKKYLRSSAGKMVARYMKAGPGYRKKLIQLIGLGLMTDARKDELFKAAQEQGDTELCAYLLDLAKNAKKKTQKL